MFRVGSFLQAGSHLFSGHFRAMVLLFLRSSLYLQQYKTFPSVYPQTFPVYGMQPYRFGSFVFRLDRRIIGKMFSPFEISPSV